MRTRTLALLALAGLVVLAGCTGTTTDTETPVETGTVESTATPGQTPTDTSPATPTETSAETPAGDQPTTAAEVPDEVPTAATLRAQTLAAMGDVTAYTADINATINQSANNLERTSHVQIAYAVDRTTRQLEEHRNISQAGIQYGVDTYIVNETIYQYSERFTRRYGSSWVKNNISANFSRTWQTNDQLWRYRFFLANASLSSVNATAIDGQGAYAVTAHVNETELGQAYADFLDVPTNESSRFDSMRNLTVTFWIDAESNRPIRVERSYTRTTTVRGQTITITGQYRTSLAYGSVSISLPDGASKAVSLDDQTTQ